VSRCSPIGVAPFEGRHQVPLLRRWHQAHIAFVRCAARGESSPWPCSFGLRKRDGTCCRREYAKTLSIEVILVGHPHGKIGAEQAWAGRQGQERQNLIGWAWIWGQTALCLNIT